MFAKVAGVYAIFWLLLLVAGLFVDNKFIISSQVAFFCAILILTISYKSYKSKVFKKLKLKQQEIEQTNQEQDKEITLQSEKERLKANKPKLKDLNLSTAFVPYRLLAYILLAVGFISLKNHELLSISGFLIGLSAMPIATLCFGILQNKKESKNG